MTTIYQYVLVAHALIALAIIGLVLLQRGKGADAGAAFGAGASGTVFGARGSSSFFSRMTAIFATAFFASSLTLAYLSSQRPEAPTSLLEGAPAVESEMAPVEGEEVPTTIEQLGDDALPSLDDTTEAVEALPTIDEELPTVPDEGESDDE